MLKRTKIVATIGPASEKRQTMVEMLKAGMNVARLNFSHGTYKHHSMLIKNLRAAAQGLGIPLAIIADLQGPRIRVGVLPDKGIDLIKGQTIILSTAIHAYQDNKIPVTYNKLHVDVKPGDKILLADGLMRVRVESIQDRDIRCIVMEGGKLFSHKGMNLPSTSLSIPALTQKDKEDLRFAVRKGIEFVALSFVKEAKDVEHLRRYLKQLPYDKRNGDIRIIVKIEKHEAIKNFESILAVVDGVMIARGDLALEVDQAYVPIIQKKIIGQCLKVAKPVIVATQLLESMTQNARPTRAELTDVANAVMDHTDAVMLSGESAMGIDPVNVIRTMTSIIQETERSRYDDLVIVHDGEHMKELKQSIAHVVRTIVDTFPSMMIVVGSQSGESARWISSFRPERAIVAGSYLPRVVRQLVLSWGIEPLQLPKMRTMEQLLKALERSVRIYAKLKQNQKALYVLGDPHDPSKAYRLEFRQE